MTSEASSIAVNRSTRYIVISPVRNEAEYLDETIRCVVAQTVRPTQYILVNDGSSDATLEIIQRWAAIHAWIVPIDRTEFHAKQGSIVAEPEQQLERGKRAREAKEILAFYQGYAE